MNVIYSPAHLLHAPRKEIWDGIPVPYLEVPERVDSILGALRRSGYPIQESTNNNPEEYVRQVHDSATIGFLKANRSQRIVPKKGEDARFILDSDEALPVVMHTHMAALSAVGVALEGADQIREGQKAVYSLCRPPGHHASSTQMGGYCFFNNAAVAAQYLREYGAVGILDIDLHHGNGTQEIVFDDEKVLYASLHGEGAYPTGLEGEQSSEVNTDTVCNITIPATYQTNEYLGAIDQGLERVRSFGADVLIVSAGFDTSEHELDELEEDAMVRLTRECYYNVGKRLASLDLPLLVVQEGGYNIKELGNDVYAFLSGIES